MALKHGFCNSFVSLRALTRQLGTNNEEFLRLAREAQELYRLKLHRSGSKVRELFIPSDELKHLQQRIDQRLLRAYLWPDHLHGGAKGKSHVTNARVHAGARYLAKLDIKDFFPSITRRHVFKLWLELGFSPTLARKLTQLTTYRGFLPQGAPASPSIANLVLITREAPIVGIVEKEGHRYTRFVDDIAISGLAPHKYVQLVVRAIQAEGLQIKRCKTDVMGKSKRQEITGCTLNSGQPSRRRVHRTRILRKIDALKYVPSVADSSEYRSVQGSIENLRQTNPAAARRLSRLLEARVPSTSECKVRRK